MVQKILLYTNDGKQSGDMILLPKESISIIAESYVFSSQDPSVRELMSTVHLSNPYIRLINDNFYLNVNDSLKHLKNRNIGFDEYHDFRQLFEVYAIVPDKPKSFKIFNKLVTIENFKESKFDPLEYFLNKYIYKEKQSW